METGSNDPLKIIDPNAIQPAPQLNIAPPGDSSCSDTPTPPEPEPTPQHNDLLGLQGGTINERYHLTKSQWQDVTSDLAGYVDLTTDQSIGGHKTFTTPITVPNGVAGTDAVNLQQVNAAFQPLGSSVTSFNTRIGAVTLTSTDVNTAVGHTTADDSAIIHKTGNESKTGILTITDGSNTTTTLQPGSVTTAIPNGSSIQQTATSIIALGPSAALDYNFATGNPNVVTGNPVTYTAPLRTTNTPSVATDVIRLQDINGYEQIANKATNFSVVNDTLYPTTNAVANLENTKIWKQKARIVTTVNTTLSGFQTINGVTLVDNDLVLVTGQTDATQNGMWIVHTGSWVRSADTNTGSNITGSVISVGPEDSANPNSLWLNTNTAITLNTTNITFTLYTPITGTAPATIWKQKLARVISVNNITLSAAQTINGVSLSAGDTVLVVGQITASNNGLYTVQTSTWTRATDAATAGSLVGATVRISNEDGLYPNTDWINNNSTITLGTTGISFVQTSEILIKYPFAQPMPYVFRAIKDIRLNGADKSKFYHLKYFFCNDVGTRFNITVAVANTIGGTATDVCSYFNSTGPDTGIKSYTLSALSGSGITGNLTIDWSYITGTIAFNNAGVNSYTNMGLTERCIFGTPDENLYLQNAVLPQVPFPLVKTSVAGLRGGFISIFLNNADRDKYYYIANFEKGVVYGGGIGTRWLINIKQASDTVSAGTSVCSYSFQDLAVPATFNPTGIQELTLIAQGGSGISGKIVINWDVYPAGVATNTSTYQAGGIASFFNDAIAPVETKYSYGFPVVKRGKNLDFTKAFISFYLSNTKRNKYYYISNMENAKSYGGSIGTRWIITINEADDINSVGTASCQYYFADVTNVATKTGIQVMNLAPVVTVSPVSIVSGQVVIDWDAFAAVNTSFTCANYKEGGIVYQVGTLRGVIGDYTQRDNIQTTVTVDPSGGGDYVDIPTCYAAIGPLSNYDNQYLIRVLPGRYLVEDQVPPAFSNTVGIGPLGSVVFYSTSGAPRILDQQFSSKLTNLEMDITNSSSYVIHVDTDPLSYGVIVNTNCRFIHRGGGVGAAVIGGGAWPDFVAIWKGCDFTGFAGAFTTHTKENTDYGMDLRYYDCSFGSGMNLGSLGTYRQSIATFEGCDIKGNPPGFFISLLTNQTELYKYPANNINWTIRGHSNKGSIYDVRSIANGGQALQIQANAYSQDVTISGTAVDVLFGANNGWRTTLANSRIYGRVVGWADVRDIQSGLSPYTTPRDVIQMWKRLGDCSSANKTLIVTVNGTPQTYTFNTDYTSSKPSEATIITAINAVITNATMSKVSGINIWDIMDTSDKMTVKVGDINGLITDELVLVSGYSATKVVGSTAARSITGIVLYSGKQNQIVTIWTGAFYTSLPDGEYGVGSDSKLSISEANKVGYIRSGIFTPYYGRAESTPSTAGGDLTGTYPSPIVNTINSVTKSYYDPTSSIQTQLNSKQATLSGTGLVRSTGGTITYENYNYVDTSTNQTGIAGNKSYTGNASYGATVIKSGEIDLAKGYVKDSSAELDIKGTDRNGVFIYGATSLIATFMDNTSGADQPGVTAKFPLNLDYTITAPISTYDILVRDNNVSDHGVVNIIPSSTFALAAGTVTSVAGTSNRITSTGGTTPVIDISASYVGQSSITTLGTIGTGVWQGTAIGDTYISSASTWNAKQAALSGTGFVKSTAGTISYDTSTYITGNQSITLSGDISGSGTTAITTTIGASKVLNSMIASATIDLTTKVTGLLPDGNISSATNWNTAYTNRITTFTTTGSSGVASLSSNTLNIPNYTLSGLGGVATTVTIAGFALSGNITLASLTASTGLTGTAYNGSSAQSWTVNLTTGLAGGQSVVGGTAASEALTLVSTSHATKGKIYFGAAQVSAYDGVNNWLGVGTNAPVTILHSYGTTEQLRLSYDATHYCSFTVASGGNLTISPVGATVSIAGNFATTSTNYGQFYTSYCNTFQPYDGSSDLVLKQRNNSFGFTFLNSSSAQQAKLTGAGVWTWNAYGLGNIVSSSGGAITASQAGFIQASADLTAQTTAGNITTFTVGASTATFNVSSYINVTAVSVDVIQGQITYTDENNTAQTISLSNISAIGNSTYNPITIRAKNGTVITVKTNLTTGAGSITFDAGARIMQM